MFYPFSVANPEILKGMAEDNVMYQPRRHPSQKHSTNYAFYTGTNSEPMAMGIGGAAAPTASYWLRPYCPFHTQAAVL